MARKMATIYEANLIAKFQYAYDNKWGYIYGAWHETWTQAKQNSLVNKFVSVFCLSIVLLLKFSTFCSLYSKLNSP